MQMKQGEFNQMLWDALRIINADKRGVLPPFANVQRKVIALDNAVNQEELRVEGDFVYVDPLSTGQIGVKYNTDAMPSFPFRASTGVRGFPYKTLLLNWTAQPGLVANLWYGFGAEIIPPNQDIANIGSITSPVSLNPEDARYYLFGDDETKDAEAFIGGSVVAPVAAQVGFVQLWNPVGSGKILYVDQVEWFDGTGPDRVEFRVHNAAIGAVVATEGNKYAGGAASSAEVRFGTTGAIPGTLLNNYAVPINTLMQQRFKAPLAIPEGFGYHINAFTVNHSVGGNWQWREKLT
jgi:hypothetical protein